MPSDPCGGGAPSSYPPMKLIDMYFWEVGYELSLAKDLSNPKVKSAKKIKLRDRATNMGFCNPNASPSVAANQILLSNY